MKNTLIYVNFFLEHKHFNAYIYIYLIKKINKLKQFI